MRGFSFKRSIYFSFKATSFLIEPLTQKRCFMSCKENCKARVAIRRQFARWRERRTSARRRVVPCGFLTPVGQDRDMEWEDEHPWEVPAARCHRGCRIPAAPFCLARGSRLLLQLRGCSRQLWRRGGSHVPWPHYRSGLNSFSCFICRIVWALWKFNPVCIFLVYVLVYYKTPWNLTQMLPLRKNYHSSFKMGKIQTFSIFLS